MKLKELVNYLHVGVPNKAELTSPCGYVYSEQEYQENIDKFMDRVIYDITFRGNKVKISLFPCDNNE